MKTTLALCLALLAVAAQARKTDREVEGLKGAVKGVVTERAKLSMEAGRRVEDARLLSEVAFYDESGNLTERYNYNHRGKLSYRNVYSLLDGERVVKMKFFPDAQSPPAVQVDPPPGHRVTPLDPRYDYKFQYRHDARGNRVEESWYQSDGQPWLRRVDSFDGGGRRVERLYYNSRGQFDGRTLYKYDADGQEAEVSYYRADGSLSEKWAYTYESDAQGNWVARRASKWVTRDGKSFFEPYDVSYRKITYY